MKKKAYGWAMVSPTGVFYTACASKAPLEEKNTDGDLIVECTVTYENPLTNPIKE